MTNSIRRRRITAASPTPAKLATFLRHFEEGGSVSAARRTGIGRNTVSLRRKTDPAFARGWEKAMVIAADALRDVAITRARDGTERALWWRDKRVGVVREYDNQLLMFLRRTLRPEVYGRLGRQWTIRTSPDNSGHVGTTPNRCCPFWRA
jgi:hypothetical protein